MSADQKPARTYPTEDALRTEAVRIARYACDGDKGRLYGDPVFTAVTEGRQKWKGYSSCGDLAHYVLRELGVRDERILNRDDDGGVVPWKVGKSLSRLVFNQLGAFVWASGDKRPKPGDILYMSKPEHVAVLEELDEAAGSITTYDYGQWDYQAVKAAGKRCTSRFAVEVRTLKVGKRTLHGWLDISRLPGLIVTVTPELQLCPTCPYANR
jgi:hypothetical protein